MAAAAAPGGRQPRRGPAPIASFDHDGSDESSPESKGVPRLPEIRETLAPEQRGRSHSTPAATALTAPPAPRIDISRASSSSHHDSRDSSPELALFAGGASGAGELGFREDGALDLRSSTEELSFLEPAPPPPAPPPPAPTPAPAALGATSGERRHSRKDSQSSEAALLGVSGRTSRLSSVGSAGSAVSRVSRLSVASGASRSPSPHRMLLETSFCGPKPIETDPEACAAAVAEHILDMVKLGGEPPPAPSILAPAPAPAPAPAVDARDRREVRTEATVEPAPARPTPQEPPPAPRPHTEERRARPRVRREPSEPEVYKPRNRSKDIIRIKLKPDEEDVDEEESESTPTSTTVAAATAARPPVSLALGGAGSPRRRSPSPGGGGGGAGVSRKSSFCSLFKSRETIASPDSPSEAARRKRSLTEGRSRSKSRDGGGGGGKLRGSVLSLFRTPRRSLADSSTSRDASPVPAGAGAAVALNASASVRSGAGGGGVEPPPRADRLKYYEETRDGIIHIPLRTPPDESGPAPPPPPPRRGSGGEPAAPPHPREQRPASAPAPRAFSDLSPAEPPPPPRPESKPLHRTVLPDGTIIIPLHSPTERTAVANGFPERWSPPELELAPVASPPQPPPPAPPRPEGEESRRRRKERLVFTTQVGSRDQVFSTQFSITKTPSVTSEMSGSFPSFAESDPPAPAPAPAPVLRDTHVGDTPPVLTPAPVVTPPRGSSESEPSSEAVTPADTPAAAGPRVGNDVERRGLVVQDSFEEELPYVPTTLPQERTAMVPMVPVRERGGTRLAPLQRPRGSFSAGGGRVPPPPPPVAPPPADKLRIKLPRRPRLSPAPDARTRTRSSTSDTGAGAGSGETRPKQEWIDFEEVPERRKQPKRIQTLPAAATADGGGGVVFSYVEPEQCRCECHAHAHAPSAPDGDDPLSSRVSTSSSTEGDEEHVVPEVAPALAPAPAPARGQAPARR